VPELPPPPGAGEPVGGGGAAVVPSWSALARSWVVGVDGRLSGRRVAAFAGGALAVVVVGVLAWRALVVVGAGGGPPPELTMPRASPTSAAADGGDGSAGTGSRSGAPVVAHVAGAVARPGLYRLGGTPRIADAIDAAGGPAPDADLDAVNLAAPVADGERVYLPRRGELPPPLAAAGATAVSAGGGVGGPLDLNTATEEQLEALPGIGPATAAAIVSYRREHGRFGSVDELLEVRGIGEAKLAELRSKVRVR
jgi:competence protein ComEA